MDEAREDGQAGEDGAETRAVARVVVYAEEGSVLCGGNLAGTRARRTSGSCESRGGQRSARTLAVL